MTREEAAAIVRREWAAQGVDDDEIARGVAWFPCRSKDEDGSGHRGARIRLS